MFRHLAFSAMFAALVAFPTVSLAGDHQKHSHHGEHEQPDLPTAAVVVLMPTEGNQVKGTITLTKQSEGVHFSGEVTGLTPGEHGFHIHEYGDLRDPAGKSAGGHFNPTDHKHGSPEDHEHHVGDLGNITANSEGVATIDILSKDLKIHFVLGRAIVVHGEADDFTSQPSGDAGPRVALGVIGVAEGK
ncbi:Superoxide dismutase [Planctomycetales bacterium 10988]|nr:Superoxide dismutase [Planctomycetales bacterium 10988]